MRSSNLATALAAAVVAAGLAIPAAAAADPLGLSYTSTTDGWSQLPGRAEQTTYQPCFGASKLVGIGAWVRESAPDDTGPSTFALGRMWNVSIQPYDNVIDDPAPDSTLQVADNLFSGGSGWTMGESTTCADNAGGLAYPSVAKRNPKRSRTAVSVRCTGNRSVLGGGGFAAGPFRSQRLVSSAPLDGPDKDARPDDGWRIAVDNLSGKARRIEAFAICANVPDARYVSKSFRAKKRSRRYLSLSCPPGQLVVSGGVLHRAKPRKATLVATRFPKPLDPTSWLIEVDNLSKRRSAGRAFAICHA